MKRLSLKLRISIWFTLVVAGISVLALVVTAEIYRNSLEESMQDTLISTVEDEAFLFQTDFYYINALRNDKLKDTDFLVDNIRIMLYDADGNHMAGLFLDNELDEIPFDYSDQAKTISIDGKRYYYYDEWIFRFGTSDIWIRGVSQAEHSFWEVLKAYPWLWFIIPAFLIIAFAGGYWLTGRFLKPIKYIDEAAEKIRQSGDLSTRIVLPEAGDEISALTDHINRMLDKLEDNFVTQKQFSSNVSHELRTPVSVIMAQCEYALDNAADQDDLYDTLHAIQKQGYKMSGMIESLLLFNRISRDTDKYQKTETDISSLVISACEDFNLIAEKNIRIETSVQENISAPVNKDLFSLMLNNLIQNAIRYGKENGHVYVILKKADDLITLSVADDGEGISKEDLPHIWELFYRGDKSRSSKGTGLGLPLVKQIVEYHGGYITVESEEGKGTSFHCSIPC